MLAASESGLSCAKCAADVAGDDLHAFVVQAAAQIGFALDIDEAGFAHGDRRGDADGLAEGVAADFEDAQAVDLAGARAVAYR